MIKVSDLEIKFKEFRDDIGTRLKTLETQLVAMKLEAKQRHEESTRRQDDLMKMMAEFMKKTYLRETTTVPTQPTQCAPSYDDFECLSPYNKTDYEEDEKVFENTRSFPKEDNDEQGKEEKGVVKVFEVGTDEENNSNSVLNKVGRTAYGKGDDTWVDVGLKHGSYLLLDRIHEDGWYFLDELGINKEPLEVQLQFHGDSNTSSGDNGAVPLRILQAEDDDDDEKQFQADLPIAVRQSLDAFHSLKKYPNKLTMPEDMLIEGEDSCVTSIEVDPDSVNGSGVYGTGLKNEVGEYNCFLNVIIQSLWHLRRFREDFLNTSTTAHLHVGDPCVTCALYNIFSALNLASTDTRVQAVVPTSLWVALSNLYPESNSYKKARKEYVDEGLELIFDCLDQSFTTSTGTSDIEVEESNVLGSWECQTQNKACIAHSAFGMEFFDHINCYNCGLETRHLKHTSYFHPIGANTLRTMKAMRPESSFDELLNLVERNDQYADQYACDPDDGGCGNLNYGHQILSAPPHVFTTVLWWQTTFGSVEDIKATLAALSTEIDLSVLYDGLDPNNTYRLVSVVCYNGQHYHSFAYGHVNQRWVMYGDKAVKVIGRWEDVVLMCEKRHLQPHILFYEAVNESCT